MAHILTMSNLERQAQYQTDAGLSASDKTKPGLPGTIKGIPGEVEASRIASESIGLALQGITTELRSIRETLDPSADTTTSLAIRAKTLLDQGLAKAGTTPGFLNPLISSITLQLSALSRELALIKGMVFPASLNGRVCLLALDEGVTIPEYQVVTTITSNATLSVGHEILLVNTLGGAVTVTLPTAVGISGKDFFIKNIGTNPVTIDGDGSETIDGNTTKVIAGRYESFRVTSDNANWVIQ